MPKRKWIVSGVLIAGTLAVVVASGLMYDVREQIEGDWGSVPEAGEAIRLTADEVIEAYRKDRKQAERALKEKACEVSGIVARVSVNWLGAPVVEMRGERLWEGRLSFVFAREESDQLGVTGVDDRLTIRGICQGKHPRFGVRFRQCTVVMEGQR